MTSFRRMDSVRRLRKKSADACAIEGGYFGACCLGLVVGVGLCVTQIAIGFTYLNTCPAQPMVPVFLIVGGSVSLFFSLTCRPSELSRRKLVLICDDHREGVILIVLGIFLVGWLIVGSVFIINTSDDIDNCNSMVTTPSIVKQELNLTYTLFKNTTNPPCPYCHHTVLNFAYAVMIAEWCIVVLLALSWPCGACVSYIMLLRNTEGDIF